MKISSDDYDLLLKVLINGLESKTLTVDMLKREVRLNDKRTKEMGEHKVDPAAFIQEAIDEATELTEEERPKKAKAAAKSALIRYVEDFQNGRLQMVSKKLAGMYLDEKGITGQKRQNMLSAATRERKRFQHLDTPAQEKKFEEEDMIDYEAWLKENK